MLLASQYKPHTIAKIAEVPSRVYSKLGNGISPQIVVDLAVDPPNNGSGPHVQLWQHARTLGRVWQQTACAIMSEGSMSRPGIKSVKSDSIDPLSTPSSYLLSCPV
jgi:hypothetical protein